MTTSPRIIVSLETVRAAMVEWHSRFQALSEPQRADRVAEQEQVTPQQFADATAQHMFDMLSRHAELS